MFFRKEKLGFSRDAHRKVEAECRCLFVATKTVDIPPDEHGLRKRCVN
jgi:hypothetical protein